MRITAAAKEATRQRILDEAAELFRAQGFEATTTRDIAAAAEIATGTLFNYFATKEAIVATLAADGLEKAHARGDQEAQQAETLQEALFALVAAELRQLKPFRKYLQPLLETVLSPLAAQANQDGGESLRLRHLEAVTRQARHFQAGELSPVALQLYWTLYTGVLAFWANDRSPRQEDTLALLDHSLAMFVAWLVDQAAEKPLSKNHR